MHRYAKMHAVWREFGPPVYVAVAAYLGFNKPKASREEALDGEDFVNFLRQFPQATGSPA